MAYDRYLIAPINSGLVTNSKSWLQPDDAFEFLQNVYVFRQRLRKRFGSKMMGTTQLASRLRMLVDTSDGGGTSSGTIPGAGLYGALGQMFSIGSEMFTVDGLNGNVMNDTGSASTKTFNLATGVFVFTGVPALTSVYWYPSLPVMGIDQYMVGTINNHPSYAFDTRFAYIWGGVGWERSGTGVLPIWHGTNTNYIWATNWQGIPGTTVLFVTNFQVTNLTGLGNANDDPIWYTQNGTTWLAAAGVNAFYFLPGGNAKQTGPYIKTCKIILPFKDRLLCLFTIENDNSGGQGNNTAYKNRCRYSFNGSPFARDAWYEANEFDNSGGVVNNDNLAKGAGYIDATTEEAIISAEFIRDRLIVGFERSTWELVYTQNELQPFIWQKLNTELGSQSEFSTVPFDKDILTIGNTGVHACNGSNVRRIDDKIPDKIFEFGANDNSALRTCGVRNYYTEMVYWAYVSDNAGKYQKFPNQVLVYNYQNGSWSINDDCLITFGYFEQQTDETWESSAPSTWENYNQSWVDNVDQTNQRIILAGTPEGFILKLVDDQARNAPSMYITKMIIAATGIVTLTIIDHNLDENPTQLAYDDDFILIETVSGDLNVEVFFNKGIFQVWTVIDKDTITINTFGGITTGLYHGGGTAARVSNIQIITKNYNPYVDKNKSVFVAKIDFAVEKTATGAITVDYYTSTAPISMIADGQASGAMLGTSVLETFPYDPKYYPLEQYQELLWHSLNFQSSGEFIQLVMYFDLQQMMNPNIALVPFEIEAMVLYTQPTSDRMQ